MATGGQFKARPAVTGPSGCREKMATGFGNNDGLRCAAALTGLKQFLPIAMVAEFRVDGDVVQIAANDGGGTDATVVVVELQLILAVPWMFCTQA